MKLRTWEPDCYFTDGMDFDERKNFINKNIKKLDEGYEYI